MVRKKGQSILYSLAVGPLLCQILVDFTNFVLS